MDRFGETVHNAPEGREPAAILETAYQRSQTLLAAKAVNMEAFRDVYGDAEIRGDMAKVADYEKKFEADATERKKRDKKLATVVEAIFYDQASRNGWLGPGAHVLRSSPYDDFVNGVDCITEYQRGDAAAYLAMAIDATWSSHPGFKFNRIREDLSRGKLGKIKYLEAGSRHHRGKEVPKVVVGASEETLGEVIELWVNGNDETLRDHPIQVLFLEEIVDQLEGFRIFSEKRGHAKNVAIFNDYLAILKPILEEKKRKVRPSEKFEHDIVRNGIRASLVGLNYERGGVMNRQHVDDIT
jgi:hypothetical protein